MTARTISSRGYDPGSDYAKGIHKGFDKQAGLILEEGRDFKPAPNAYVFMTSRKHLGEKPFAMQIKIVTELFNDRCPYCSDNEFWDGIVAHTAIPEILDRTEFLKNGKCPKCKRNRLAFVQDFPKLQHKNELVLCVGMRGTKSTIAGIIGARSAQLFLCLDDPAVKLGLPSGALLTATFCARTEKQALKNLWPAFKSRIENSTWYKEYNSFLTDASKKLGKRLHNIQTTKIEYFHKGLLFEVTGARHRDARGATRIGGYIDELGWFNESDGSRDHVVANPEETVIAIEKSLLTVRSSTATLRRRGKYKTPDGLGVYVSSPSSVNDKIMSLLKRAATKSTAVAYHLTSLEINPRLDKETLLQECNGDEASYMRDCEAIPPLAAEPWLGKGLGRTEMIDKWFCLDMPRAYSWSCQRETKHTHAGTVEYIWPSISPLHPDRTIPRVLAVDAGRVDNSYVVCSAYLDNLTQLILIDDPVEIRPEGCTVFFPGVLQNFLLPFGESFWLKDAVFDQWQSASDIDSLTDAGYSAMAYGLKPADFDLLEKAFLAGRILFRQSQHLLSDIPTTRVDEVFADGDTLDRCKWQLAKVRKVGRKVTKPANGTDDIVRAVCQAVACILRSPKEYAEYEPGVLPQRDHDIFTGLVVTTSGRSRMPSPGLQRVAGDQGVSATLVRNDPDHVNLARNKAVLTARGRMPIGVIPSGYHPVGYHTQRVRSSNPQHLRTRKFR